jgi:putative lipoic acid-binding regulatory protein
MDENWIKSFQEKLDQHHSWPSVYTFKFIVPKEKANDLRELFPNHTSTEKISAKGNFTSITFQMMMSSGEAVIEVYKTASKIEGIIAL